MQNNLHCCDVVACCYCSLQSVGYKTNEMKKNLSKDRGDNLNQNVEVHKKIQHCFVCERM